MFFFAQYWIFFGTLYAGRLWRASAGAMRWKIKTSYGARAVAYAITFVCAGASLTSCSRAIFISDSAPARVGAGCRARVYTLDSGGAWVLSDNAVEIPEGYYIVSPRWVDEVEK